MPSNIRKRGYVRGMTGTYACVREHHQSDHCIDVPRGEPEHPAGNDGRHGQRARLHAHHDDALVDRRVLSPEDIHEVFPVLGEPCHDQHTE